MDIRKIFPEEYPELLHRLQKMPPYLYCAGPPPPLDGFTYICVVGARKYTEYGKEVCQNLICGLRNYPIVVVSGLAIGIDSVAHAAALSVGLKTLSFPGSGLSREALYPASHYHLAEQIVRSGGTLLSPFEPDQRGDIWTFPVRNQLMAGCSKATLIIEGAENSGTLITADAALNMGREVMVVPGSIFSRHSYAPHYLFGEGATPVFSSQDILQVLGFDVDRSASIPVQPIDIEKFPLSAEEKQIIRELQRGPLSATDLIEKTRLSAAELNVNISALELEGLIRHDDGLYHVKNV